jgi:methylation protein EvaC
VSTPECRVCGAPAEPFMSFGPMPIANAFVTADEIGGEYFGDLEVGFCPSCTMVQLVTFVDPAQLFHDHYAYFSSTSARMADHFAAFAEDVRRRHLGGADPFVVELGSNDGIMLRHFAAAGIRHLGVEPSANVAETARSRGVNTVCRFFDAAAADDIRAEYGPADALLGANVICHIPDLNELAHGVARLLAPGGVFVFEEPYLGDIVEKTSYDQIYDEHYFYFSVSSLSRLFARHGLEVVDAARQTVHGGSMRYTVARVGAHRIAPAVTALQDHEARLGLHDARTFAEFRRRVEVSRTKLVGLLQQMRALGKRVVGYGATSKSTTVLNYCGIGPDLIEFISDVTPGKQNRLTPGTHIPIRPYRQFVEAYPDYALLFAWNHADEILAKETAFLDRGGQFIVYVPDCAILAAGSGGVTRRETVSLP